ncbi:hypothetical protein B0H63DRAFT_565916 [Podospora didyma]|uniref:Uncharacterized protein n=1 Tax=Podospora didyma TaxID=330526 RepID=A0AAE0JZD0_9PEZI|nr:hypothetical protein B0H63DRAFT_565916 [Podospora didyma]
MVAARSSAKCPGLIVRPMSRTFAGDVTILYKHALVVLMSSNTSVHATGNGGDSALDSGTRLCCRNTHCDAVKWRLALAATATERGQGASAEADQELPWDRGSVASSPRLNTILDSRDRGREAIPSASNSIPIEHLDSVISNDTALMPAKKPVDRLLRARQTIRFHATGHPNATAISQADLEFARQSVPTFEPEDTEPADEPAHPINWAQTRNSIDAFLGSFRNVSLSDLSIGLEDSLVPSFLRTPTPQFNSKAEAARQFKEFGRPPSPGTTPPPQTPVEYPSPEIVRNTLGNRDRDRSTHKMTGDAPPGPNTPLTNAMAADLIAAALSGTPRWPQASDVGYFDPSAKDKDSSGAGIIADGKVTKYTNVFPFCDLLVHLESTNGADAVRRV